MKGLLHLVQCSEPGCMITAAVRGSAVGLRAVGWSASRFTALCPTHHPDQEESATVSAVLQYSIEQHYDSFLARDAERMLLEEATPPQPVMSMSMMSNWKPLPTPYNNPPQATSGQSIVPAQPPVGTHVPSNMSAVVFSNKDTK